jgi:signal transduction histidine kinase
VKSRVPGGRETLIVIVDDDDLRRYTKGRVLRNAGFEVQEASNGADGIRLIHDLRPRLAIVDVGLPDMSGHEVCRQIKSDADSALIPVLQISATFVTDADTVSSLDSGADASLVEPIEPQVMIATVRALLRARQADEAMREALEREQAARNAAEETNRVKDEFLAVLSHELRTPLAAILSWATLLRGGDVDDEKRDQGLSAIERNARMQSKLIEDLLDVSRIISGKTGLDIRALDFGSAVRHAVESVRASAEEKGLHLELALDPDAGTIRADATRMQQVIWNLLSNAIKFTPAGGTIRVEASRTDTWAVLRVADTGKGIPAPFLPHVFERFRQADSSSTRSEGGLGLGLAIVRHIVDVHGGTVRADSAGEGKGAEFTVQLPLDPTAGGEDGSTADADEAAVAGAGPAGRMNGGAASAERAERAAHQRLDGIRILVVDDERDARDPIAAILQSRGAKVTPADSVAAAQRELGRGDFDVVVSDIGMPGADGYALIRDLRADERSRLLPVLALSAYANAVEVRRAHDAGFDATLAKPVDAGDLLLAVARLARPSGTVPSHAD